MRRSIFIITVFDFNKLEVIEDYTFFDKESSIIALDHAMNKFLSLINSQDIPETLTRECIFDTTRAEKLFAQLNKQNNKINVQLSEFGLCFSLIMSKERVNTTKEILTVEQDIKLSVKYLADCPHCHTAKVKYGQFKDNIVYECDNCQTKFKVST